MDNMPNTLSVIRHQIATAWFDSYDGDLYSKQVAAGQQTDRAVAYQDNTILTHAAIVEQSYNRAVADYLAARDELDQSSRRMRRGWRADDPQPKQI